MGNKTKRKTKRLGRRKIRIRLADPNIPDSYVCEIFDSSLETEEEPTFEDVTLDKSFTSKDENSKPKNFFEVLMSNESRKSFSSTKENEKISEYSKVLRVTNDEETVRRQKNNEALTALAKSKTKNTKLEIESSDDENLLEIQKKFKLSNNIEDKKESQETETEKISDTESEDELQRIFEPPKTELPKKKTLSILNFLSKGEKTPNGAIHKESPKPLINGQNINESSKTCLKKNGLIKHIKSKSELDSTKIEQRKSCKIVNKENVKLAPLFQKKEKMIVDVTTQKARHDFLFKGLPTVVKKSESIKSSESFESFPSVAHIQQRNESNCWSMRQVDLPLPLCINVEEYVNESVGTFRLNINHTKTKIETKGCAVEFPKKSLSDLKSKYLNLSSIIDGLKDKKDRFEKRIKEIEKNFKLANDESSLEILNTLWIDKYKPKSDEILGNEIIVKKIRKWLESWKTFDRELKLLAKSEKKMKKEDSDNDDSDNFLWSDEENFGLKTPGNVCLLSGPNGCGKTSLIYALAGELEFNVLEVNASSNRTGKKVLSELQEATQSHKVHRVNLFQNETQNQEVKKRSKKRKKRKKSKTSVEVVDQGNDCKISLILIEDADIVFEEHDEGFFSAIASLVQNSKRPIVFLTNDSECSHLESFKTENSLVLEMECPNFYKSLAVLDTVCFLEGSLIDTSSLQNLLRQNHFDLRKCLLELQFWIHCGSFNLIPSFDLGHLWWGLSKFLYNQEMRHTTKPKVLKRKKLSYLFDSSDEEDSIPLRKLESPSLSSKQEPAKRDPRIYSCCSILDLGSMLDSFQLSNNLEPTPGFECKTKDSLSLDENMEEVTWSRNSLSGAISEEIVFLTSRVFSKKLGEIKDENKSLGFVCPSWEEIRWRKSREEATKELSVLVPLTNVKDSKSVYLDYLPMLRNICKIERNRSTSNTKRKNRFNHYLNNFGLQLTDYNLETNCEAFES